MFIWIYLYILIGEGHTDQSVSGSLESDSQLWWGLRTPQIPQFVETPTNITSTAGDSAFLPCTVAHLADRSVTWMRQKDLHILTAGVFTFSADKRFRVVHPEETNDWTLQIQYANTEDSGVYECQVNSDPKISKRINLKVKEKTMLDDPEILTEYSHTSYTGSFAKKNEVHKDENPSKGYRNKNRHRKRKKFVVPSVHIDGPHERYIEKGSVLTLRCTIRHRVNNRPKVVDWLHGTDLIEYNGSRGGISVNTEKEGTKTVSELSIASVSSRDSGEYTCSPSNMVSHTIIVHAQNGDQQQAVHQKNANSVAYHGPARAFIYMLISIIVHILGLIC